MASNRRWFLAASAKALAALGFVLALPRQARACLVGRWKVRCPNGHVDIVDDVTCNHRCDTCKAVAFKDGAGTIVCPAGHLNQVSSGNRDERDRWVRSYLCTEPTCRKECRLDAATSQRYGGMGDR